MNRLFSISKWFHKYLGLLLVLFLMWMSLSGILLNHPSWISSFNTPKWLVPSPYEVQNWNQGTLREAISLNSETLLFAGVRGIWISRKKGAAFEDFNQGLSPSLLFRKTNDIYLDPVRNTLFAATDGGLFHRDRSDNRWKQLTLGDDEHEPIKKILPTKQGLLIVTDSRIYASTGQSLVFVDKTPTRPESGVEMIKLFFDLHDGKVWGLPGRLLFDLTGLILFFLSLSGLIIWVFPKFKPFKDKTWYELLKSSFRFCFVHHLKWSIWFGLPLFFIGATGVFMRPPLLVVLADHQVPKSMYPGPIPSNPWFQKIKNATYIPKQDRLIVEADGLWEGPASLEEPFQKLDWDAPIFVMGTNVFQPQDDGSFLLGSFSGLLDFNPKTHQIADRLTGETITERSKVRVHEYRVTGYFKSPGGEEFIGAHRKGLVRITPNDPVQVTEGFPLPEGIQEMPLWNFLFELHNGRIFSKWIGVWSKLLVPVASIFYVILCLTGFFDWLMLTLSKKKRKKT